MIDTMLVLASLLAPSSPAAEPATCIRTSIGSSGRTTRNEVVVSSGNRAHDRGAVAFLRAMDFAAMPVGVELDQTGHILVRRTGPETYTVDVTDARLLAACPAQAPAG